MRDGFAWHHEHKTAVQRLGLVQSLKQMAHFGKADGISGVRTAIQAVCVTLLWQSETIITHHTLS